MRKKYIICGLKVLCDFRYPIMNSRAEKYLCDFSGEADIVLDNDEGTLETFKAKYPHLSMSECEVMNTTSRFYRRLIEFGGFMLHSSAVAVDGSAYLFSAPSGTGKSTHVQQWVKLFGEKAQIINDDKPAIIVRKDGIFAAGTPWSGKSELNLNKIVPLKGICVLERSEVNRITPLPKDKALFFIMNQTLRPSQPELMDRLLNLLDMTLLTVPVWKLGCNISTEAAKTAYEAMSGAVTE